MTSSTIFCDVVLPAATWYEKHDINTTDMHPFIHSFNPAISPPWQTKTDWDTCQVIAEAVLRAGRQAPRHPQGRRREPLLHDTADAMATPHGVVKDWRKGECEPVPGKTMPKLVVVERDYGAIFDKMGALGPLMEKLGMTHQGRHLRRRARGRLPARTRTAPIRGGVGDGRPSLKTRHPRRRDDHGAVRHDQRPPRHPGLQDPREAHRHSCADLAAEHEGKQITFADTQAAPVPVITSPEWSGSESGGRRYSPVHDQRRAAQAVAHPDRAPALLPRPRLDASSSARACRSTGHR